MWAYDELTRANRRADLSTLGSEDTEQRGHEVILINGECERLPGGFLTSG